MSDRVPIGDADLHSPDVPNAAVARLAGAVSSAELQPIVARYLGGELSAQVALMQMVIASEDAGAVRAAVDEVTAAVDEHSRAGDSIIRDRVDAITRLVVENETGCGRIAAMLRSNIDHARPAPTVDEGLAHVERLFDWSVSQSEEASVALYSLGNAELLEQATAEIVRQLERWGLLGPDRVVLQVGCGIGRFERALAGRVKEAHGIDVSGEMVRVAQRRCAGLPTVHLAKSSGRDLGMYADEHFDLVYAVDTFPYLVQSGRALVERHFAEARRVLRPGGELLILNYSYGGDIAADDAEVRELATRHGFTVLLGGERVFELWDGVAWRLGKIGEMGRGETSRG
jgi:ubiquinone/menaquinone biosynthesis C-methylase UbiE